MSRGQFLFVTFLALAGLAGGMLSPAGHTQAPKAAPPPPAKGAKGAKEMPPPPPEEVKLDAKDGWAIHATYYPGKLKKKAIPFILLHGWKEHRGAYDSLALYLQSLGHAVIVPDLRGHGQSNVRPGSDRQIEDPADLKKGELDNMGYDLEACKTFLRLRNNAGECNLESLCVVAADFSCILAVNWSALDWSAVQLPSYKNGQDVKALVLLSPKQSFKGLTLQKALLHPAIKSQLSLFVVAGKQDATGYPDAKKLNTSIENFRPDMKKKDVKPEDRTLVFLEPDTNLFGTKLLNEALPLKPAIGAFVKFRLVDRQEDFPWTERKSPLEN